MFLASKPPKKGRLPGGCLGLGLALETPESPKTKKNKWFSKVFGFQIEPVLASLEPVLGCGEPVLGCLVLSWTVMELF